MKYRNLIFPLTLVGGLVTILFIKKKKKRFVTYDSVPPAEPIIPFNVDLNSTDYLDPVKLCVKDKDTGKLRYGTFLTLHNNKCILSGKALGSKSGLSTEVILEHKTIWDLCDEVQKFLTAKKLAYSFRYQNLCMHEIKPIGFSGAIGSMSYDKVVNGFTHTCTITVKVESLEDNLILVKIVEDDSSKYDSETGAVLREVQQGMGIDLGWCY